jgi:ribosome-associated protein
LATKRKTTRTTLQRHKTGPKTASGKGSGGGLKAPPAPKRAAKGGKKAATAASDDRGQKLALTIAQVALEHKALNVEIIDVHGKVDYSDYVVVMSGRSDRQVSALGRNIEEGVRKKLGTRCLGIEGMPQGTWLLMDYGDVVVHVFHEDTRGYYDLETLWIDAARIPVSD